MKFDLNKVSSELISLIKSYVSKSIDTVNKKVEVVEKDISSMKETLTKDSELIKKQVNQDYLLSKSSHEELIKELKEKLNYLENLVIPKGQDGRDGRDGKDGRDGRDGDDGLNALDIDIVEEVNFDKSYPKKTYAKIDGGLFVSTKKTEGRDGWKCIIEGIKEIKIESLGARSFAIKTVMSSNEEKDFSVNIPAMIYNGIYEENEKYEKNDVVTFGGSMWIAEKDTNSKPGLNEEWRLCVKKGRDGKNGKDGEKGIQGKEGRRGLSAWEHHSGGK